MRIKAFNTGTVTLDNLQLTPEIEKHLENVKSEDQTSVKELLCVYANNEGKSDREDLLLRKYDDSGSALLPTVVKTLSVLDEKRLAGYKKKYLEILPYFAWDFGDIVAVAREFPRLLEMVESAKRDQFVEMIALIVAPKEDEFGGQTPSLCIGGGKVITYLERLAQSPDKQHAEAIIAELSQRRSNISSGVTEDLFDFLLE